METIIITLDNNKKKEYVKGIKLKEINTIIKEIILLIFLLIICLIIFIVELI
jgi:hypothetical protein